MVLCFLLEYIATPVFLSFQMIQMTNIYKTLAIPLAFDYLCLLCCTTVVSLDLLIEKEKHKNSTFIVVLKLAKMDSSWNIRDCMIKNQDDHPSVVHCQTYCGCTAVVRLKNCRAVNL
jgi:hypothetical protein